MAYYSRKSSVLPLFALIATLVVLPGCELFGNISSGHSDLASQKRTWAKYNSGTYSFTLQRGCFCIYGGRAEIQVRDNVIVHVVGPPEWNLGDVPVDDYQYFQTVDEMFDLIEQAYAQGADDVEIVYSRYGYPTSITIDYLKDAVDDELHLGVSDLVMALQ